MAEILKNKAMAKILEEKYIDSNLYSQNVTLDLTNYQYKKPRFL